MTPEDLRAMEFTCPACGSTHFGRDTSKASDGTTAVLSTVQCHDEFGVGCTWRGIWPPQPTI